METPEYELYGLSEEDWNALTEEERQAYRGVGEEENQSEATEDADMVISEEVL